MVHDSRERYGALTKLLRWSMALLVFWQLLKFGDRIAEGEHWVGQTLVPWHVSIGTLLLVLIVLRLAWVARQRHQRPAQDPATAKLVKAGHGLLFAGMLGLAALNRYRLTPALAQAIEEEDAPRAQALLRASLVVEGGLAIVILGLVAWLGTLSPPMSM